MLCRTSRTELCRATCEQGQPQCFQHPVLLDQHLFSVTDRSLGMSTPHLHTEKGTPGWIWGFLSTRAPEG